jgi:hypothetical protein
LDELVEIVTLTIAKRNICESIHTQSVLSIMLDYLASGDTYEDLKFINAISLQSIGIILLETCLLLGRQTITE